MSAVPSPSRPLNDDFGLGQRLQPDGEPLDAILTRLPLDVFRLVFDERSESQKVYALSHSPGGRAGGFCQLIRPEIEFAGPDRRAERHVIWPGLASSSSHRDDAFLRVIHEAALRRRPLEVRRNGVLLDTLDPARHPMASAPDRSLDEALGILESHGWTAERAAAALRLELRARRRGPFGWLPPPARLRGRRVEIVLDGNTLSFALRSADGRGASTDFCREGLVAIVLRRCVGQVDEYGDPLARLEIVPREGRLERLPVDPEGAYLRFGRRQARRRSIELGCMHDVLVRYWDRGPAQ
jgi:hypothetical protein